MGEFLDSHPFSFYIRLMFYDLGQQRGEGLACGRAIRLRVSQIGG